MKTGRVDKASVASGPPISGASMVDHSPAKNAGSFCPPYNLEKRRCLRFWFFWLCLVCFPIFGARADVPVPKLTARVTDLSGTLSASALSALEQKLALFEKEHGSQMAVLMVSTTLPETIEQYSLRVAEAWKIGRKKRDDGVLVLIAKNDRKVRIEVGYGLEGAIPDVIAKRIIEGILVPHFKRGDFDGGIDVALGQLMRLIQGEGLDTNQLVSGKSGIDPFSIWLIIFSMIFLNVCLRRWLSPVVSTSAVSTLGAVAGWFLIGSLWGAAVIFVIYLMATLFGAAFLWNLSNVGGSWKGGGGFGGGGFGGRSDSGGGGFSGGGGSFGGGGSSGSW